jgi:hypothetical protein
MLFSFGTYPLHHQATTSDTAPQFSGYAATLTWYHSKETGTIHVPSTGTPPPASKTVNLIQ